MVSRFRSWWHNTSKTLDAVIVTLLVVLIALLVLIILGYSFNWKWAGLSGKTLWDWLQLLIIPAVLAVGGYLFNYSTSKTEHEVASDRQREEALQAYIDSMSELLLEKKLRESSEDDEVRKIARVRTLTVLPRLDGRRKATVLQFLHESGLIDNDKNVIDLTGANLRGADLFLADLSDDNLSRADLRGADLLGADLSKANLFGADLRDADLNGADLSRADLSNASLIKADLSDTNLYGAKVTTEHLNLVRSLKFAIMPDGTKHA